MDFRRDKKGELPLFTSKDFTDEVLDYLKSLCNLQVSPTGAGRLDITRGSAILTIGRGAAAAALRSLQLFDGSTPLLGLRVGITPGTLAGLFASEFPDPASPMYLSVAGAGTIIARVDYDATTGVPTACSITDNGGSPTPPDDSSSWFLAIGGYVCGTSVAVSSFLNGSQSATVAQAINGNWEVSWSLI